MNSPPGSLALIAGAALLAACVPTGSSPPFDAGVTATAAPTYRPSLNIMTAPFEDNFDRPDASEGTWPAFEGGDAAGEAGEGGAADGGRVHATRDGRAPAPHPEMRVDAGLLAHLGEGGPETPGEAGSAAAVPPPPPPSGLGPNWVQIRTSAWRIENGRLCVQNAHNRGVWLNRTLPVNVRIEFDAVSSSDDGDLKAEVFGDGQSAATGTSYTNASSYLAILGGWKNTLHVLARLNEHGHDRKEIRIDKDSDDPRQRPVVKDQVYHFKIERTDGKTLRWSVDGLEYITWADDKPLIGQGHDHFGFNEWEAKVCYDNVKVTPL